MRLWFKYFLFGGLSCWGPEIVVAAIGAAMHRLWEWPNVFLPLTACIAYLLLLRSERRFQSDPSIAGSMLIGIWVLAPTLILIESTFKGGGFRTGGDGLLYILLFGFMPWYVLEMATYDLSLGALLLVTIFLAVGHWRREEEHWILLLRRHTKMVLGDKS
jgi:uncharacterized membrane protein